MKKPSAASIAAVMILITIGSASALNLIDPSYRPLDSDQQAADHVNVPVHCEQGHCLADHHCVSAYPPSFCTLNGFPVTSPASSRGGTGMRRQGNPDARYVSPGS